MSNRPTPRRHARRRRLPAPERRILAVIRRHRQHPIGNITVSVLNRADHRNHAAARRGCCRDCTGLRALELLGL